MAEDEQVQDALQKVGAGRWAYLGSESDIKQEERPAIMQKSRGPTV